MKKLRIQCFQHVPFEGPGYITEWASASKHTFTTTHLYQKQALPALDDLDFLIIMGGPMGACEESKYPFLVAEKAFIRSCIESGKIVLGICLGAQLIASAMGAPVVPNRWQEIGWFSLHKTEMGRNHPLLEDFDTTIPLFHWHGDTFGIPSGAVHLLKSDACINQAFLIGSKTLALQFHLEMTPQTLQGMIDNCGNELLNDTPYIQSASEILENTPLLVKNNQLLAILLNKLIQ